MSVLPSRITSLRTRLFVVPLPEVPNDAKHGDHTHFQLVNATITLEDGSEGTGYTYTGGRGGHAIKAMLDHDIAPTLVGMDGAGVEEVNDFLEWHIHYVGRGGIASFAISAVDVALWDIRCRRAGEPLWKMAGGAGNTCKAYCGAIDLQFAIDEYTTRPLVVEDHRAVASDEPGTGVVFNWDALDRYEIL